MLAGIRFSKVGKIYHFNTGELDDLNQGDAVIVETVRGMQLGWVVIVGDALKTPENEELKTITRKATPQDLVQRQMWKAKEESIVEQCRVKVKDLRLSGVKIVDAEFSFDGSRLTILYNTEGEEKVDLKNVRQDVQRTFGNTQIELRQIVPGIWRSAWGAWVPADLRTDVVPNF